MRTYSVLFRAHKDGPEWVFVCGLNYHAATRVAASLIEEGFVHSAWPEVE
jgi:hypothetical protein